MSISNVCSATVTASSWMKGTASRLASNLTDRVHSFVINYLPYLDTALLVMPKPAGALASAVMPISALSLCETTSCVGITLALSPIPFLLGALHAYIFKKDIAKRFELYQNRKNVRAAQAQLEKIFNELPKESQTKSALVIFPSSDWNGAIFRDLSVYERLANDLAQEYRVIPIFAVSGRRDLARKVEAARKASPNPVEAVIINAHGTESEINFELTSSLGECYADNLIQIFSFLPRHSRMIFLSCEAGKELTAEIAHGLEGVRVFGPTDGTNSSRSLVFLDERLGRPSVRYLDKRYENDTTAISVGNRSPSPSLWLSEILSLEKRTLQEQDARIAYRLGKEHEAQGRYQRAFQWYRLSKEWCKKWQKSICSNANASLERLADKQDIISSANPADRQILKSLPNLSPYSSRPYLLG